MDQPDDLTLSIARHLEVDWQYIEYVEARNTARIAEVRSAGREAGRLLDHKVATVQTEPDDEDRVMVVVVVRETPSSEKEQRMAERARLLMNEAWSKTRQPD